MTFRGSVTVMMVVAWISIVIPELLLGVLDLPTFAWLALGTVIILIALWGFRPPRNYNNN